MVSGGARVSTPVELEGGLTASAPSPCRRKGYPLKQAIWSRLHWRIWDRLSSMERLAYERYIEENDNAKVSARIRGHAGRWLGKRSYDTA